MKNQIFKCGFPLFIALLMTVGMWSCSEDRTTNEYQTHPTGWTNPAGANFHGTPALKNGGDACKDCHGADFHGGTSGSSCYGCHVILHNDVGMVPVTRHQAFMASANWDLNRCGACHGADFTGGSAGFSCTGCHTRPSGPSDCRTCHAMPIVNGGKLPYGMPSGAEGAHEAHSRFACIECHAQVTDLSHTGPLPAEVTFANAELATAHGSTPTSQHLGNANSGNASCSSVYCHSNGSGGAPVAMPQWVGGGLSCGGCHRMPPDRQGHPQIATCHQCHENVDPNSDYSRNDGILFIDESLHVNGVVN